MTTPATTELTPTPARSRVGTPRRRTVGGDVSALDGVRRGSDRFLDRELSWLAFNERVLELAQDPTLPLLERVRFLAIFASNLDEFFRVRVAGLKRRMATGLLLRTKSGLKPREELARIAAVTDVLARRHAAAFHER